MYMWNYAVIYSGHICWQERLLPCSQRVGRLPCKCTANAVQSSIYIMSGHAMLPRYECMFKCTAVLSQCVACTEGMSTSMASCCDRVATVFSASTALPQGLNDGDTIMRARCDYHPRSPTGFDLEMKKAQVRLASRTNEGHCVAPHPLTPIR